MSRPVLSVPAVLAIVLTLVSPAHAAPATKVEADPAKIVIPDNPDAPLPVDPHVRIGHLPNGLTYYVEENHDPVGRAELRLAVKAGSTLEDEDQRGLAHFVEHMAFNGTRHFAGNGLISYLESIGTQFGTHLNAYTNFDETVYRLQVPTDDTSKFETGILVLRDWADGVLFDPEECEKEKGVVREEWRLGQGLQQRMQDAMFPKLYAGSRYAERLPIGTGASLDTISCEATKRFYETWYRPDLMAVMAVGDFDPNKVEKLIKKWFGDMKNPAHERERTWYTVPDDTATQTVVFADPELSQSAILVSDRVPEVEHPTHRAYREFLLEQIVFLILNERLAIEGQNPNAPALGAQAGEQPLGHLRAQHVLEIAPKEGHELEALAAGVTEIERMHRYGFTQGELDRARDELMRNMRTYYDERDKTESTTHIEEQLRVFLTDEPMPGIPYEYALSQKYLPSITLTEANHFAKEHAFPGNGKSRTVAMLMPTKPGLAVPTEAQVLQVLRDVEHSEIAPPVAEASTGPLLPDLPTPGKATKVATDAELGTTTWKLSNGVIVVLKRTDFQEDEVLFAASGPGGTSTVSDEDYVPAVTATSMLLRSGVGNHDAVDLAKLLAGKEARVSPSIGRTRERLRGGAAVRDLETMMQLLWLGVTEPRFDEQALQLERQGRLETLRNRASNPDSVFEDKFTALEWKNNPRQTNWSMPDLEHLDLQRSRRVYERLFGDFDGWTFVFVGNVDEATLVPLIERYLATLPTRPGTIAWQDDHVRRVAGVQHLSMPRGQTPRGHARILFHGAFDPTPQNRLILDAVAAVLETRLREELRENLGGTYGVSVDEGATKEPVPTYELEIDFETDPHRLDELLKATWEVIDEVRTTTWSQTVIDAIREKNRRSHESAMRTNGYWLGALEDAIELGEDPHLEIVHYDELNQAITADAIREMAASVLDKNQYIEGVQQPDTGTAGGASPTVPAGAP